MQTELYLSAVIREMDRLPCAHPASVNLDVANTYFALTKLWRPLLVVEIGCFIGFSTQHFAEALRYQGFGQIISIDAFDWDVETQKGLQNRYDVAEHYRHKAKLESIITYVKGYSTEVYPTLQAQLQQRIDLLYIDGDHSVAGVFADFNSYYNDVRIGGYILLHDIYPVMCGVDGPRILIDTLRQHGLVGQHLEITEMNTRDGYGICVLRKLRGNVVQLDVPLHPEPAPEPDFQIHLHIQDAHSGQPIKGAQFNCAQRFDERRVSDANGHIFLPHYRPNRYQVSISAAGYKTQPAVLLDLSYERPQLEVTVALEPVT